jgi:hypothetical protein
MTTILLNKWFRRSLAIAGSAVILASCQKSTEPAWREYPEDSNPPGGPLKFYAAFDGTTDNPLMNAVDSIRANFAADNPLTAVDGVSGKGVKGEAMKFIKYAKPNDFAITAKSFAISFWYKRDGQTKNNKGGNGPEYPISFRADVANAHWSVASMFVIIEGNNAGCAVKVMTADKNKADNWFTWENADVIPGMLDNQWHHIALVYDQATSGMTLYLDGVANPKVRTWNNHGAINFANDHITEMRIGNGPGNNLDSDDWLSSSWKGELDQVRLYGEAISAAEVQALFNSKK